MNVAAIRAERLSKQYRIGSIRRGKAIRSATLRDAIVENVAAVLRRRGPRQSERLWALKDVSFEIQRGETVGVIGRNGAGKTTLFKVLSRITEPTSGRAEIRGRVASLLEVGTGFHPELTGRENIYLNGALLGMKRRETDAKFDEIVEFSEVAQFLDTPVKRYSSGMYVRLAFAVAAHLDPDILLIDEVLAVGDAAFQKKCLGKMRDVAGQGRTVVFVSHNMGSVAHLCRSCMWIDGGHLRLVGATEDVVATYLRSSAGTASWERPRSAPLNSKLNFLSARVYEETRQPAGVISFHKPFLVEVVYQVVRPLEGCAIAFRVSNAEGVAVLSSSDRDSTDLEAGVRRPGIYRCVCCVPGGLLRDGSYFLRLGAFIEKVEMIDKADNVLSFEISPVGSPARDGRLGVVTPVLGWTVERVDGDTR